MKTAPPAATATIAPPTVAVPTGETRKSARASVDTGSGGGVGLWGVSTGVGASLGVGSGSGERVGEGTGGYETRLGVGVGLGVGVTLGSGVGVGTTVGVYGIAGEDDGAWLSSVLGWMTTPG